MQNDCFVADKCIRVLSSIKTKDEENIFLIDDTKI